MPVYGWVVIAVAIVAVIALALWITSARRRTGRLQSRFGPEYERTVESVESKRKAEAELRARQERRDELELRPLSEAARARYTDAWQTVQSQFVDDPHAAVAGADSLIQSVMTERGYPVSDFEQRAADVSVDHPDVVLNYREGRRLALASRSGDGSTENLRRAMRYYRLLFEELVGADADAPLSREPAADGSTARRAGARR
jgi:hypothetical protein